MNSKTWLAATLALTAAAGAQAQGFSLEGAVIDSRSSQNLGVVSERGDIATLFKAQKAMTFGILRSAGISLDQLPPEVRARIERFQTTNVDAFRAFSQGLDLKDQGKFAEAKEYFRRAAELDPGFALAAEQQRAMPDVNITGAAQARAVVVAAGAAAVDRGKASFVVDVARAAAALAAGATVVTTTLATAESATQNADNNYTSNPAGSSGQFVANLVTGLSYQYVAASGPVSLAQSNEWRADNFRAGGGVLESAGTAGDFFARREGAALANRGSTTLADGTVAYWGSWISAPGASAALTTNGSTITAPVLGQVDYLMADATRAMPTSGTATFRPAGGLMNSPTGTIAVNFVTRDVALQNLGFTVGSQVFSGLTGNAQYSDRIASGAFSGNYSGGNCTGCAAFTPLSSAFSGNFVGTGASGLVFSTILLTGNNGIASGVQLFSRP